MPLIASEGGSREYRIYALPNRVTIEMTDDLASSLATALEAYNNMVEMEMGWEEMVKDLRTAVSLAEDYLRRERGSDE